MRDPGLIDKRTGRIVGVLAATGPEIRVRSGFGLGDNMYLHCLVAEWNRRGTSNIHIYTAYPELFKPLRKAQIHPYVKGKQNVVAHYAGRKSTKGTTQFQDMAISAGLPADVPLRFVWARRESPLTSDLIAKGKKICLVQMPQMPMARTDNFAVEVIPNWGAVQRLVDRASAEGFLVVQIGKGASMHRLRGVDVDLSNKTSVAEVMDLGAVASIVVGQIGHIIPLAEGFDKPCIGVMSIKTPRSAHPFIRTITKEKLAHKSTTHIVMDDKPEQVTPEVWNAP